MEQENTFLGEEKIHKLLMKFSIPCILSLLISALYNIVDQIFVGNSELGYLGNAATGIVFPILIIAQAFAWCIGDGSAAYLSLCQGRKDTKSAHQCIGTGITITLIISVILLTVFLIIKEPLLRLFGASDNTIGLAIDYFVIVIPFFPIFMIMNMMNSVIRADGSPAFSMIAMAAGAVVNIILDPVFIFACHFGIAGAAWATVIGQVVSFVLTVIYCFRTKTFKLLLKSFIPNFRIFKNALLLGISTFITQMSIVIISLVCNIMLAKYGALSKYGPDIPISAISIETKVFTIIINIVVGIVLGGQPIIGYNYGAGNMKRVKKTYQLIILSSLIVGLVSTLIIEVFPDAVIGIFGSANDPLYLEFSRKLFRIFLSLVTGTCLIKMTSIFFQAVGQTVKATIVSLTRDIICFIPLVVCLPLGLGIDGILYAAPIADAIGILVAGILTILFFKGLKQHDLKLEEKLPEDRL
ncbi:MAG: MATE family efflux transporter [Anaeroplasmataceae bacterium]|nr:MATE family efflux transporter [Anaeroplasmataceae bacterium]